MPGVKNGRVRVAGRVRLRHRGGVARRVVTGCDHALLTVFVMPVISLTALAVRICASVSVPAGGLLRVAAPVAGGVQGPTLANVWPVTPVGGGSPVSSPRAREVSR